MAITSHTKANESVASFANFKDQLTWGTSFFVAFASEFTILAYL